MNPFAAHAANMKDYERMCSEPVNGVDGNYVIYGGVQYTAVVGPFTFRQVLVDGGVSMRLSADVIIQKDILPAGTVFKSLQKMRAVQVGGGAHDCVIDLIDETYTEWRLQLWDQNEGS